ncbi:MAG: hypothetical protein JNL80_09920 [Phycisphaerae bacterium]|nr:hypothetical protein [Phycisphaerae bacterium]
MPFRHATRSVLGWMLLASVSLTPSVALAAIVVVRGGAEAIACERIDFERGGLRITKAGVASSIPWDQVQTVTDRPLTETERGQLAVATELWRARSRVQRGDYPLASALLEKHFATFRGSNTEVALIVAEGLLRCRLSTSREADRLASILPALEVARLRRAKITTDRYATLPPVLDDATLLSPALAPTWQPDAGTEAIATEIDRAFPDGATPPVDAETLRMARVYAALLRGAAPPVGKREEGGVGLLAAMAELSRTGADQPSLDAEARAKARTAALSAAKSLPTWARGWAGFAVGRSLVAEEDRDARVQGVLRLLEVAALGPDCPPSLANEALALSAEALRTMGDAESAAIVERELAGRGGGVAIRKRQAAPGATTNSKGQASEPAPASNESKQAPQPTS